MNEKTISNENNCDPDVLKDGMKIDESHKFDIFKKQDPRKPYKCEKCTVSFYSKRNLASHTFRKHGVKFAGELCEGKCRDASKPKKPLVESHKSNMHANEKPFQCEVCLKIFATNSTLNVHLLLHSAESPYKCSKCSEEFKRQMTLDIHMVHAHGNGGKFICAICEMSFVFKTKLKDHLARHRNERKHVCDQCGSSFNVKGDLARHTKVIHANTSFQCEVCSKKFPDLDCLKRHSAKHLEAKPFKCDLCSARFAKESSLKQHANLHLKRYKCEHCSRLHKNQSDLVQHKLWKHVKQGQFACDICGESFKIQFALNIHLRKHNVEKDFRCDRCPKVYKIKSDLSQHKFWKHGEGGKFPCDVCGKCFNVLATLKLHSIKHSDERNVKCDQCDMMFKRKANLASHYKVHMLNTEKPFPCEVCPNRYLTAFSLKVHSRVHFKKKQSSSDQHKNGRKNNLRLCEKCGDFFKTEDLDKHFEDAHGPEDTEIVIKEEYVKEDPDVEQILYQINEEIDLDVKLEEQGIDEY